MILSKRLIKAMLHAIASDTLDAFDEEKVAHLMSEKSELHGKLVLLDKSKRSQEFAESGLDEICTILDGLKNHPMTYDDQIVRQILERVVVESKEKIKEIFKGGMEAIQTME